MQQQEELQERLKNAKKCGVMLLQIASCLNELDKLAKTMPAQRGGFTWAFEDEDEIPPPRAGVPRPHNTRSASFEQTLRVRQSSNVPYVNCLRLRLLRHGPAHTFTHTGSQNTARSHARIILYWSDGLHQSIRHKAYIKHNV